MRTGSVTKAVSNTILSFCASDKDAENFPSVLYRKI